MKLLTVELTETDGKDSISWSSDAATSQTFDRLIAVLGQFRAEMHPPVKQEDPQSGESLPTIHDPRWRVGRELTGDLTLSVRHPGFGWLTFRLPARGSAPLLLQRLSEGLAPQDDQPAH